MLVLRHASSDDAAAARAASENRSSGGVHELNLFLQGVEVSVNFAKVICFLESTSISDHVSGFLFCDLLRIASVFNTHSFKINVLTSFGLCVGVTCERPQALVIKLSSSELSHVQRIATRCRDAKQCAMVFKDSFRGLTNVLSAHAAHHSSNSAAMIGPPPSSLHPHHHPSSGYSHQGFLDNHRAASAPPSMARNGASSSVIAPVSANPLAVASARVEALRLLQGLVIAYENMSVDQRNKAVLKEKAFAGSLGSLLEVCVTFYFYLGTFYGCLFLATFVSSSLCVCVFASISLDHCH